MANQTDEVKNDIISRLMRRELLPGDPVDEAGMQERLGISGTPIREALIALEAAGTVERRRRGGAIVSRISFEDLIKYNEVLAEVEAAIAGLASQRISPSQAEALQQSTDACLDHVENHGNSAREYYDLNVAFHAAMGRACGNEFLKETALNLERKIYPYLAFRLDTPVERVRSAKEHVDICAAILGADAEKARDLMRKHVLFSNETALTIMNSAKRSA